VKHALWLPVILWLSPCAPAHAAVLDILADGSGPYADLEQALGAAQPGDTLRLGDGIYTGPGNRNLILGGARLTILSASGQPGDCVLDLEGQGRAFLIYSTPATLLRIEGITLRAGDPRQLPENQLRGCGGGLAIDGFAPGGTVIVDRCIFEDHVADAGGGAFLHEAEARFSDCIFRRNSATDGAGAYCGQSAAGAGVRFAGCLFHENDYPYPAVGGYGAGVYYSHSTGSVASCTFAGNRAWLGGGILVSTASVVEVDSSLIAFSTEGQGLAVHAGVVTIALCDIFGNEGGDWVGAIAGLLGVDCNISADPLFCDAASGDYSLRDDSPCLPENNGCGLMGALGQGCGAEAGVAEGAGASSRPSLRLTGSPIRYGAAIEITCQLKRPGPARLRLFDPLGRPRATIFEGSLSAGVHRLRPRLERDAQGEPLASGLYWLRLESADGGVSRSLLLVR